MVINKIQIALSYVAGGIVPMIFWLIRRRRYIPLWKFILIDGIIWAIFVILISIEVFIDIIGQTEIMNKFDDIRKRWKKRNKKR